jgi:hypothetical protein
VSIKDIVTYLIVNDKMIVAPFPELFNYCDDSAGWELWLDKERLAKVYPGCDGNAVYITSEQDGYDRLVGNIGCADIVRSRLLHGCKITIRPA